MGAWFTRDKPSARIPPATPPFPKDGKTPMDLTTKNRIRPWPVVGYLMACMASYAGPPAVAFAGMVSDFGLVDVNPTSSTYEQVVSPRDYLKQVSGWYFGHAT